MISACARRMSACWLNSATRAASTPPLGATWVLMGAGAKGEATPPMGMGAAAKGEATPAVGMGAGMVGSSFLVIVASGARRSTVPNRSPSMGKGWFRSVVSWGSSRTAQYASRTSGVRGRSTTPRADSGNRASKRTGTPRAARVVVVWTSSRPASGSAGWVDKVSTSPGPKVARAKRASAAPAPACTNTCAPAARAWCRPRTKSTGAVACAIRISVACSGVPSWGRSAIHEATWAVGACSSRSSMSRAMAGRSPSKIGEWKACDTSRRRASRPRAASACSACSTAAEVPDSVTCRGWLRLATATPSIPAMAARTSSALACTADILPVSMSSRASIALPRKATKATVASRSRMPPWAMADISPRLWPSVTSARTPASSSHWPSASDSAASAGWHTAVAVSARAAASSSMRGYR